MTEGKETTKLTYDDRRKILIQTKTFEKQNEDDDKKVLSNVKQVMNAEYTEAGIKLAYKNLSEQKTFLDNKISKMKKAQDKLGDMPEDLIKLKESLETLAKYQAADKEKLEFELAEAELKKVKGEIAELKQAIGTRLKL